MHNGVPMAVHAGITEPVVPHKAVSPRGTGERPVFNCPDDTRLAGVKAGPPQPRAALLLSEMLQYEGFGRRFLGSGRTSKVIGLTQDRRARTTTLLTGRVMVLD